MRVAAGLVFLCALVPASDSPLHKPSVSPAAPDHECRFWGIIGAALPDSACEDQLVSGTHALMKLAADNHDGWGLAYFSPALLAAGWDGPALVRGGPPADHADDTRYAAAVARMLALDPMSAVVHLRRSSGAHTGVPDPHPFWRDGVALAHNGRLTTTVLTALLEEDDPAYLDAHPPDYASPYIDSELLLLYILQRRAAGAGGVADAVNRAVLGAYGAGAIETAANLVVTSGDTLIGVRFDLADEENFKLRYRELPGAWVIASEPLGTDTTGWAAFPPKSLGIFTTGGPPEFVTIFPPPDPYLVIDSTAIDDDLLGDSHGNGDGNWDAGERIELIVTLRNDGYEPALNARATLATDDSLCQVLDAVEDYGDIPAGGEAPCMEDFDLLVDPACPDGHAIPLTLTVECDGPFVWHRAFSLSVHAPAIAVEHYAIEDLGSGNGNGRIEPGERFRLSTTLENRGAEQATGLQVALEILHPFATVLQGEATLDTLPSGGWAAPTPPFEVALAAECPAWDVLYGWLTAHGDWGLDERVGFLMPVGGFRDDVEAGPGAWTVRSIDPEYINQWARNNCRNYTPGGSWSWKFGGAGCNDYVSLAAGALESEPVPLRPYSYLRFRHWMESEVSQTYPGLCYDGGFVEMLGADSTWRQILPVGGYPYRIRNADGTSPFAANTPVFAGVIDWDEAVFEILGATGEARFRFVFGSDDAGVREGWYIDEVEFFGGDSLASVAGEGQTLILHPAVGPSRPNPGGAGMRLRFDVPSRGEVGLDVYDVLGRRVRTLVAGTVPPGRHEIAWDGRDEGGRDVASGTYFCRLSCAGTRATHRLVFVR